MVKRILISVALSIVLITGLTILIINANFAGSNLDQSSNENSYDSAKKYYEKIDFETYVDLTNNASLAIIGIDDSSSYLYNNFKELINMMAFENNITIYYLETSKLTIEEEVLFLDYTIDFIDYKHPYMVIYQDGKLIEIKEDHFEALVIKYLKLKGV